MHLALLFTLFFGFKSSLASQRDPAHCEVCIKTLTKFENWAQNRTGADIRKPIECEKMFREFCKTLKSKEEAFCYYIGALETSATSGIHTITQPLSYFKPIEDICKQDVNKLDEQICNLRYEKEIDWANVNLSKMKANELKQILTRWGEKCHACSEKSEFISKINEVKHKYINIEKAEL